MTETARIDHLTATTLAGDSVSLGAWAGQVRLIVNVASRCGLAPQYEALERLQRTYGGRGFTVLGFPSNQFLQELGSAKKIATYCSGTWGVTFPMFESVRVNGRSRHPLYAELTRFADAHGKAGRVTWNFEKFLVGREGAVTRFRPHVVPDAPEVIAAIESALAVGAAATR